MEAATTKLSVSRSGSLGRRMSWPRCELITDSQQRTDRGSLGRSSSTIGRIRASLASDRSRRRYRSLRRRNDLNDSAISTRHTAFRKRKSAGRSRDRKPFVARLSVCMAAVRSRRGRSSGGDDGRSSVGYGIASSSSSISNCNQARGDDARRGSSQSVGVCAQQSATVITEPLTAIAAKFRAARCDAAGLPSTSNESVYVARRAQR